MQTFQKISIVSALLLLPSAAFAVDGVVLINQAIAMAGNITPGDTPGFPVTISQPGSYRLSSNLVLAEGQGGILISSDNVTLDLNGFSILGSSRCGGSGSSFSCTSGGAAFGISAGSVNITIRNGFINGIGEGAAIECIVCKDVILDHLQIINAEAALDSVNATGIVVRDCVITATAGLLASDGVIEGVVLAHNFQGANGTSLTVRDSVFFSNQNASFVPSQIVGFSGVSFISEPPPLSGFSLGQNTLGGVIW